ARLGLLLPRLPGALVDQAEFVARPEVAIEVELPPEDVRQLRDDAGRGSGVDRVLAQAVLDPSCGPPYLGEEREPGARRVDSLRGTLENEVGAVVDLVVKRLEVVRRAIEAQGEAGPGTALPEDV